MIFDKENYRDEVVDIDGSEFLYRAYRDIVFVEKPVEGFHRMNIFVPKAFYEGQSINGYSLKTAPIVMPNGVGGYWPADVDEPARSETIMRALKHGYVVASPAIRGRTLKDDNGINYGKAPACIVDYKAAVRFLHKFAAELLGDDKKIITNGTSAGGALSSLMGATGNHPDYEEYLGEIGAVGDDDSVFAASCYCPIINLDNADMAYEWQFDGIYDYHRSEMVMTEGGRPEFTPVDGMMNSLQIQVSKEESALFPAYVNSLNLKGENGQALTLDEHGDGSFKEYVKSIILASAQKALDSGMDLSDKKWLTIDEGNAVAMDFVGFSRDITRMKNAPSFDDVTMNSGENHLFGDAQNDFAHFTSYSMNHSIAENPLMADEKIVKMLNPMYYVEDKKARTARYFRIRHGECDRDTSIAISVMFVLKLREIGCEVDYASPWNVPHAGDYDLEELFEWIDMISRVIA